MENKEKHWDKNVTGDLLEQSLLGFLQGFILNSLDDNRENIVQCIYVMEDI